jgi:hypothetical protein
MTQPDKHIKQEFANPMLICDVLPIDALQLFNINLSQNGTPLERHALNCTRGALTCNRNAQDAVPYPLAKGNITAFSHWSSPDGELQGLSPRCIDASHALQAYAPSGRPASAERPFARSRVRASAI